MNEGEHFSYTPFSPSPSKNILNFIKPIYILLFHAERKRGKFKYFFLLSVGLDPNDVERKPALGWIPRSIRDEYPKTDKFF
jgi:hypothetical protein